MQPPGGRRGSIQFVRSPTEKALSILLDTQTFIGDAVQYQVSHGCKNLAVIAPPEFRGGALFPLFYVRRCPISKNAVTAGGC